MRHARFFAAFFLFAALVFGVALGAVTDTSSRRDTTGDGSTKAFSFTFPAQKTSDIEVYLGGVKQTTGFTTTLAASPSVGGTVTFTTAPLDQAAVRIQRTIPLKQECVSPSTAKVTERCMDRTLEAVQQTDRRVTDLAAGTLPPSSDGSNLTVAGRALYARFADTINVKDAPYNAKGDGTTDDTTAVQAAIDASSARGGGRVFIPDGTYIITPNTLVLKSGVHVVGAGRASVLKVKTNAGDYRHVFAPSPTSAAVSNVLFSDLRFDQNCAANATTDIRSGNDAKRQTFALIYGGSDITFERMWFDPICGVNTVDVNGVNVSNVTVRDSYFRFVKGTTADPSGEYDNSAIFLHGTNLLTTGNVCESTIADRARGCIELHGKNGAALGNISRYYRSVVRVMGMDQPSELPDPASNNFTVAGNTCEAGNDCINAWSATGHITRGISITGNVCRLAQADHALSSHQGISTVYDAVSGTLDGDFADIVIEGNTIAAQKEIGRTYNDTNSGGIKLQQTGALSNVLVRGNSVRDLPSAGISIFPRTVGMNASHVTVSENAIFDAGNDTSVTTRAAIYLHGIVTDTVVEGNMIGDSGVGSAVGRYAIDATGLSSVADVVVRGNVVPSNGVISAAVPPASLARTGGLRAVVTIGSGGTASYDLARYEAFETRISGNYPWSVGLPFNALRGQRLTITTINANTGAIQAPTVDPIYKLSAAWPTPASANRVTMTFYFDGTNWYEASRTAEVPN